MSRDETEEGYKRQMGALKSKMHELVYKMSCKLGSHQMIKVKEADALARLVRDWSDVMFRLNKLKGDQTKTD